MADIRINGGGVYWVTGGTPAGTDWIIDNLDGDMTGCGMPIDGGSYAEAIAAGALGDGLTVEVNGGRVELVDGSGCVAAGVAS